MKLTILIFLILLLNCYAQEEVKQTQTNTQQQETTQENIKDEKTENAQNTSSVKQRTKEEIIKERDGLQALLKTLNYSCVVLARMQLSRYGSQLMKVIESHENKQEQHLAWKKIYTSYVNQCQKSITYDDSVKIFAQIQSKDFKFDEYTYIYDSMNLEDYTSEKLDLRITQAEEKNWQYIQEFEKAMDQKEEDDDDSQFKKNLDLEPKIFGISLKSRKSFQYLMFFIFISFIGYLGYIAVRKLPKSFEDSKKKRNN